jgi:hypothetical protein
MSEYCCDALRQATEDWDGPFYMPVYIDRETHALKSGKLAVRLYNLTPSGKAVSVKGRATLFLAYCPLCGTKQEQSPEKT